MKAETARLLRAVLRLIEDDVRDLADAVVEIDEREAANCRTAVSVAMDHVRRIEALENRLSEVDAYAGHLGECVVALEDHVKRVTP